MGQSTNRNMPSTAGGSNLGPYVSSMVNAPQQGPDAGALAAYHATFGMQPSYAQMANANALDLINKLPLQSGRYLVNPATPATPTQQPPVNLPQETPSTQPNRPMTRQEWILSQRKGEQ